MDATQTRPRLILGPPGTGKTTYLIDLVLEEMERGVAPDRIGYLAFTKQAANVAKDRARKKFRLSDRDLPYFRTIHSLAFLQLGLNRRGVLGRESLEHFGDLLGLKLTGKGMEDGQFFGATDGDRIIHLIGRARVRCIPVEQEYAESHEKLTYWEVERVERGLKQFKEKNDLYDFTDMLYLFLERGAVPKLEVLFVDEAQDLSQLQWRVIQKIIDITKPRIYVAGDDDQAIFRWAGADVKSFVEFPGEPTVLNKSYRVPRTVQAIANRVVNRIQNRYPKNWEPRDVDGSVTHYMNEETLDMRKGEWLILARNRIQLNSLSSWCRKHGLFYSWFGNPSVPKTTLTAIIHYGRWHRNRQSPDWNEASRLMSKPQQRTIMQMKEPPLWYEALDKIAINTRNYLRAALRRKEKVLEAPRINFTTIHSAKGGQADNVVLYTDLLRKSHDEMQRNHDDEHRVFYVGLTRAKEQLHIIKPQGIFYFPI